MVVLILRDLGSFVGTRYSRHVVITFADGSSLTIDGNMDLYTGQCVPKRLTVLYPLIIYLPRPTNAITLICPLPCANEFRHHNLQRNI
jgi:hypothetical protein